MNRIKHRVNAINNPTKPRGAPLSEVDPKVVY